ncbi:hypothetical protein [Burkholderia multivorans]|uniref:hypothetical protein n=1 Tax=Burkholderia multivorans TaxID=87883 RepID=UPI000CFFEF4F|nr:hypothetical protein [Burkholderia multivorans]MBU9345655.1 hypothetical protein [Burkholderia multivorans]MBY4794719.1 hypothetical protein [Burkholderia multivorans]MCL4652271.1 hypothetical protein [Burkholderia multivorans]MCL4654501.1 hypothetical protein [Burkholderia multivorans]MCO1426780.1 hypothetical protein [Burkholderia multivorans]
MTFANSTSLITALPTILISAYVAWIAYQQHRTNREKLRLDLYDRRFGVYTASIDFYHVLSSYDEANEQHQEAHRAFVKAMRESRFLFGQDSEIVSILEEMHTRAARIMGYKTHGKELHDSDPHESRKWFEAQQADYFWIGSDQGLLRLEASLTPFLDFRNTSS